MVINQENSHYWQNKRGTSKRPYCSCGSRKDHWENLTGRKFPKYCSVVGCLEPAKVGAHIYRIGSTGTEYIAPFCNQHNNFHLTDKFILRVGTELVEANISKTCGK